MKKYIFGIVFIVITLMTIKVKAKDIIIPDTPIDNRAEIIDNYYKDHDMPLEGYGKKMVEVSDKNGLDWRLLPAISIRETSGGKHMCRSFNAFGWGSCKIQFKSQEEAIETIGYKLVTLSVYKDATTEHKLYHYNGTVVKTYPQEVLKIMEAINPS